MRPLVVLTLLSLAALASAQAEPVRVERTGASRSSRFPRARTTMRASASARVARIVIEGWDEGCTDESPPPVFRARVAGRTIHLERDGASSAPRCDDSPHSESFCAGPDGEMMDCPPPICLCVYRVRAEVALPSAGRYIVLARDGARARARARLRVE